MVIPLASIQLKPAADMMARAFQDDPYFVYALPAIVRRRQILSWLMERLLIYSLHFGKVYTTASLEGAAVWLGPRNPGFHWAEAIRTGLFLLPLKLSVGEFRRIQLLDGVADRLHAKAVTGPHWYLPLLAVHPTSQGQGIGGALLQPVLELADRENLACFLDTNNEKNLSFYEKHGFHVMGQERPDPDGPYVWGLVREKQ